MRIGVVGINHRLAELQLREPLARVCQREFIPGRIHPSDHSFILLSTCNRTEVYFSSDDLPLTHSYILNLLRQEIFDDFDQKLYSFFGSDCFSHLCRVTAGLDSAIVAETEIQGQVKNAYEKTIEVIPIPGDLHFLFQKSLQIGKRVRNEISIRRGAPSLEHAILSAAGSECLQELQHKAILFVGASDINLKIIRFLKQKGFSQITLCNRTFANGKGVAEKLGIKVIPWGSVDEWFEYDWIITGTKAHHPIIRKENIPAHLSSPKYLFDLSVPRNIDPAVVISPQVQLWNIDRLNGLLENRRENLHEAIEKAETLVGKCVENHLFQYRKKERFRQSILTLASA